MFDERAAIQLRMQQIFQERERLQEEYKDLFSRLREIDHPVGTQASHAPQAIEKITETSKQMKQWEDDQEEQIDTEEFDKRMNQIEAFLEDEE
ncbi:hypothetical protein [Halalkalibacter krulwichiae]|uniref:Rok N-terminal oligomerisation domain-containing protein n=1 Tax=Halalkalibacter krulwichiae TaxID=199441 RepID=A0A1X9M8L7_9BACI|nr:hypothetical protein [Halalkalibacter krulwichiae]ARK29746.1 hypothetical protein BkAM31D_07660 [Halalkalibacter krulwichiae]